MAVGFNDTGIFVREFKYTSETGAISTFNKEEKVEVLRETDNTYIISKNSKSFEIPRDTMIRTTRKTGAFSTNKETKLYSLPSENSIVRAVLESGTILSYRSTNKEYGIFDIPSTGRVGYIKLADVSRELETNITHGLSIVTKTVKNDNSSITLLKGEIVNIIDFSEDTYTVINEEKEEFIVSSDSLTLFKSLEEVSRSADRSNLSEINKVVQQAHSLIGKRYVYAASGPNSFDCSGFTYYIYKTQLGITLPRISYIQATAGVKVEKSQLIPGDLVFFNTTGSRISHVGLYIGDGNMIHASSGKGQVRIDTINSGWYQGRYVTARRIIK